MRRVRSDYREKDDEDDEYEIDDDDDEDEEFNQRRSKQVKRNSYQKGGRVDVIGESVNIRSTRKEVYHDSEGRRVYGSWK